MNNLNELGLVEVRQEEMMDVDGGNWIAIYSELCCAWVMWNDQTGECRSTIGNEVNC